MTGERAVTNLAPRPIARKLRGDEIGAGCGGRNVSAAGDHFGPWPSARYSSDCISISRDTVRSNSNEPSPVG